MKAFFNGRIFNGQSILSDQAIITADGKIVDVISDTDIPEDAERVDLCGDILSPGFVDLQVNGGGGVLFNDDPSLETLSLISAAHQTHGTMSIMPTLITDIPEKIDLAIAAVSKAGPDILGLHLEGPFINPERKGIHAESAIRDFDPALPKKIEKLAHERKVMITLAPECVPRSFIQDLSDAGAIVCAGHTKATLAQLSPLLGVPIKGITHLFNAMTGHHREPACIGAGLMTDQVWCSIIGDGHHVHPLTIALAARSKPAGKLFFVSDAMAVLEDQGSFKLGNRLIRIEKGHCFDANGRLAGAARPLSYALKTATQKVHLGLVEALRMITLYPANFLELKNKGRIAPGYDDDLVRIGQDLNVKDLMHQSRHAKRVSGL